MSEPSKEAMEEARAWTGTYGSGSLARRFDAFARRAVEEYRERIARWWDDTEARSAEAHEVYQIEAHRRGDVRHPDAYAELKDSTKEWDRVLVRWVAATIRGRSEQEMG